MHKASLGAHVGRRQTRQNRVLQLARDTTTGRHKGRKGRVIVVGALEHPGHGVRDIVDTRAGEALLPQYGDRFVQIAATVFEVGSWSAHLGDKAAEPLGNRVARPGVGHGDPNTVDAVEREGLWSELMVMGITGQDGHNLARAQANTDVDHPDEAVTKGSLAQGRAPEHTDRFDTDDRESHDPIDDGLRAWRFLDAKSPRE